MITPCLGAPMGRYLTSPRRLFHRWIARIRCALLFNLEEAVANCVVYPSLWLLRKLVVCCAEPLLQSDLTVNTLG